MSKSFFERLLSPFQNGARKMTKRHWMLFLGIVIAAVGIAGAAFIFVKLQNTHRQKGTLYSIVLGEKKYWENGQFELEEDNRAVFYAEDGRKLNISGQPFYYEGESAMFWPFYGLWYTIDEQNCRKVDRFSRIEWDPGKGCYLKKTDGTEISLSGYLYDNQNTYVVLENAKLSYGGQELNLTPLSYVKTYVNNSMDIYVYGEEEGAVVSAEGDPEIVFPNGARIDIKEDLMRYPNGTIRLIFGVIDFFKPVGE